MTVDMPCDCTHPKDGHAGLAYACWHCGCKRYTPDIQAASTAAILARAETMPTDSASAQLRRVEKERDEWKATAAARTGQLQASRAHVDLARAELATARAELDQLRGQLAERGAP